MQFGLVCIYSCSGPTWTDYIVGLAVGIFLLHWRAAGKLMSAGPGRVFIPTELVWLSRAAGQNILSSPQQSLLRCAYCKAPDEAFPVRCDSCGAPHHAECFRVYGHCSVYGCGSKMQLRRLKRTVPSAG